MFGDRFDNGDVGSGSEQRLEAAGEERNGSAQREEENDANAHKDLANDPTLEKNEVEK